MAEVAKTEEKKEIASKNWADDEDDAADDEDVEIGAGASVAQVVATRKIEPDEGEGASETVVEAKPQHKAKPRSKRERNIHGDFVVTKINIKEREIVIPKSEEPEEEESESEEESEEEEKAPVEEPEVKKGKYQRGWLDLNPCPLFWSDSKREITFPLFFFCDRTCENIEQEGVEAFGG